jgi:hypothetical protein
MAAAASNFVVLTRPSTMTFPGASACCIHEGRRFLNLDGDAVGQVLGGLAAISHHGRDRLAGKAHHFTRQDRLGDRGIFELVEHRDDRAQRGDFRGCHHHHALRRQHPHVAARRNRTAHEPHPLGGRQVAGEAALSGHQCRVFDPAQRAADPAA